jgi:hypothetical protein
MSQNKSLETLQNLFPTLSPEVIAIVQQQCGGDLDKTIISLSNLAPPQMPAASPKHQVYQAPPKLPPKTSVKTQQFSAPQKQPYVTTHPKQQFNAHPKQRLSTPVPMQQQNYASNNQYNNQPQPVAPKQPLQQTQQQNINQPNSQYLPPSNHRQDFWRQMVSNLLPQNQAGQQQQQQVQSQQPDQVPQFNKPQIDDEYQLAPAGFIPQGVPNKPLTSNKLTREQKLAFIDQGYIVLPNVVPKQFTDAALRVINARMGKGTGGPGEALFAKFKTWFPELCISSQILNLFYQTPVYSLIYDLLGEFERPNAGQITMRFPGDLCVENNNGLGKMFDLLTNLMSPQNARNTSDEGMTPIPFWDRAWHVDGIPIEDSQKDVTTFSLLVGVFLHDIDEDLFGNLTVYPGSHNALAAYINSLGGPTMLKTNVIKRAQAPVEGPVQVKGPRGSVVIFHGLMAHAIAPNISPNIRYVIYYRINAKKPSYRPEAIENIWVEYVGLKDLLH